MPASRSSAMTQNAPWRRSSDRMPSGFTMSKKRNSTSAASACCQLVATSSGVHTPIISSITTRLGSSPQKGMSWWVAHVPSSVKMRISAKVEKISAVGERIKESPSHIAVARIAPAVPGPHGQNPAPNPVAMTTGSTGRAANLLILS